MREFLLNRIWEEMKQANVNTIYAELTIDKQIIGSKKYNAIIAIFSSGGAILTLVDYIYPIATSIIVALVSIINQFFPLFILRTEDLTHLCQLHTDYNIYFNRLQDLFCLLNDDKTPAESAQTAFSKLTEDNATKRTDIGKIFGAINRKREKKAIEKSDNFLNTIYNGNK
jgi:hypothetical protein